MPYIILIGKGHLIGGKIKLSEEHSDFKWIKPEDLDNYNTTNETKKAFETLMKK